MVEVSRRWISDRGSGFRSRGGICAGNRNINITLVAVELSFRSGMVAVAVADNPAPLAQEAQCLQYPLLSHLQSRPNRIGCERLLKLRQQSGNALLQRIFFRLDIPPKACRDATTVLARSRMLRQVRTACPMSGMSTEHDFRTPDNQGHRNIQRSSCI